MREHTTTSQGDLHVRIIAPVTTRNPAKDQAVAALATPGVTLTRICIDDGPPSVESDFESAMATPALLREMRKAVQEGADACVIDCMSDPGLNSAREIMAIPVLGAGQTAMHVASLLGHRFSIVTVLRRLKSNFETATTAHGLATKLASVRWIDIPVLDLAEDISRTQSALVDQAAEAVEHDGAEVIIFGCTGLLGSAEAVKVGLLARGIDVPVIDPLPTAIHIAAAVVRSGLSHSAATYPAPNLSL